MLYFYATMSYLSSRRIQLLITVLQHEYNNCTIARQGKHFPMTWVWEEIHCLQWPSSEKNTLLLELVGKKTEEKKQFKIQWHEQGVSLRASLLKVALSLSLSLRVNSQMMTSQLTCIISLRAVLNGTTRREFKEVFALLIWCQSRKALPSLGRRGRGVREGQPGRGELQ